MHRSAVVLGAAALLLLSGGPALAEEPFRLDEQLVDEAGAIDDEAAVEEALVELQTEDGISLFVVFVDSFEGVPAGEWLQSTAELSDLGGNDALLAVAVEDRNYTFTVPAGAEVTIDEADRLAGQAVEPEFGNGDWAAGAVAFADILRTGEAPGSGGSDSGGGGALLVLGAVAVAGGGAYLVSRSRRRKREAQPPPVQRLERPDPYAGVSTEELQARASNALLELDEAMKTSQLDLDYARSQYGDDAVTGFDTALATSRDELSRAFAIRQQLDDGVGGRGTGTDEPTTRQMLGEMLKLTEAADARLDAQAEAFGRLRDLENTAPAVLEALAPRIAALR
ncbi:MAG: TPM domain-containing protein, partial [Actinomycetes bacterium]